MNYNFHDEKVLLNYGVGINKLVGEKYLIGLEYFIVFGFFIYEFFGRERIKTFLKKKFLL